MRRTLSTRSSISHDVVMVASLSQNGKDEFVQLEKLAEEWRIVSHTEPKLVPWAGMSA